MYHHQALAGVLVRDRVAELRRSAASAGASARSPRTQHRSGVWLLVDMGLRLAVPRGGANPPVADGRR